MEITKEVLASLNVEQARAANREKLDSIGGVEGLASLLHLSLETGLTSSQVIEMRNKFGANAFPESPMEGFFSIFLSSFNDFTILVLIASAIVSLGIGVYEDPSTGWIEGSAILIAVFTVALVTATNDYTKELQFRALEHTSQNTERTSVIRDGAVVRINPVDIVIGDLVRLQVQEIIIYCHRVLN